MSTPFETFWNEHLAAKAQVPLVELANQAEKALWGNADQFWRDVLSSGKTATEVCLEAKLRSARAAGYSPTGWAAPSSITIVKNDDFHFEDCYGDSRPSRWRSLVQGVMGMFGFGLRRRLEELEERIMRVGHTADHASAVANDDRDKRIALAESLEQVAADHQKQLNRNNNSAMDAIRTLCKYLGVEIRPIPPSESRYVAVKVKRKKH